MGPDVDIWPTFRSSKNDPKSFGICPEVKISNFGIIKTPRKTVNILKTQDKTKNLLNCLPYLWALLDPVLGPYSGPLNG